MCRLEGCLEQGAIDRAEQAESTLEIETELGPCPLALPHP